MLNPLASHEALAISHPASVLRVQCIGEPRYNLVLHIEEVGNWFVEALGPQVIPVSASISCTFTRSRLPLRCTEPSRTYRTFNSRPICFTSMGLPLKLNAVLRAMTNEPLMRDRSVVRLSVIPSTK